MTYIYAMAKKQQKLASCSISQIKGAQAGTSSVKNTRKNRIFERGNSYVSYLPISQGSFWLKHCSDSDGQKTAQIARPNATGVPADADRLQTS
jgi:hypothetical protein